MKAVAIFLLLAAAGTGFALRSVSHHSAQNATVAPRTVYQVQTLYHAEIGDPATGIMNQICTSTTPLPSTGTVTTLMKDGVETHALIGRTWTTQDYIPYDH